MYIPICHWIILFLLPTRDFFLWKRRKKFMETDLTAVILYFALLHVTMYGRIDWFMAKKIYFKFFYCFQHEYLFFIFWQLLTWPICRYSDYLKPSYIIISPIHISSVSCNGKQKKETRTEQLSHVGAFALLRTLFN